MGHRRHRTAGRLRRRGLFGDADPVPAVRELIASGTVASTPATFLSGDEVADPGLTTSVCRLPQLVIPEATRRKLSMRASLRQVS